MKSIALVNPNCPGLYSSANIVAEHLGLGLLSAILTQNGFSNEIIDARMYNLSPEQASKNATSFDVIGLTLPLGESESVPWSVRFIELCKKLNPYLHIIVGGYLPTILPERVFEQLPDVDVIVLGEGEKTILDLLLAYKNQTDLDAISGIAYRKNGTVIKKGVGQTN